MWANTNQIRNSLCFVALLACGLLISACAAQNGKPGSRTADEARPTGWSRTQLDELKSVYADVVAAAVPDLGSDDLTVRQRAERSFEAVCLRTGTPGREGQRWALCMAICDRLGKGAPAPARVYLVRKLEQIGGAESVGREAELLADADINVRDSARRALSNNPSATATHALETALRDAPAAESEWRVGLVNALRGRGLTDELYAYIGQLTQAHDAVGLAAISVYYSTIPTGAKKAGGPEITSKTEALRRETDPRRREEIAAALLRAVVVLRSSGTAADQANATQVAQTILDCDMNHATAVAALRAVSNSASDLPRLLDIMNGEDTVFAAEAAAIAMEIADAAAAKRLAERLPDMPVAIQIQLLENFADRNSPVGLGAALAVWKSPNDEVRAAASRTIGLLGANAELPRLLELAATTTGIEREAARWALGRLRGGDVDNAIAGRIESGPSAQRVEAMRATAARSCRTALPRLVHAASDDAEDVRVAAFNALGDLSAADQLPALIDLLARDTGDRSTPAAEDAVTTTVNRIEDAAQRATLVLAKLDTAPAAGRPALIRVLGRLGGDAALTAIRKALASATEGEVDAAVRALAKWNDAAVLADLEQVARNTSNDAHRGLALRAYFRLLKTAADKTPDQQMEMVQHVLPAAKSTEERKALLAALGEIKHVEALAIAGGALQEEALRDEAALALAAAARRLAAERPEAARSALEKARAAPLGDNAKKAVDDAFTFLADFAGYGAAWQYAGPYFEGVKDFKGAFETAFAPENPNATDVAWKPLLPSNGVNPWVYDLTTIDKGSNRSIYVRTWVWSPTKQEARLDTGGDDALKVWLNGDAVYAKSTNRPVTPGDDKTPITLNEGWNALLMKVCQGSGGWGFCAGVRGRDGGELAGVKYKAEP